MDWTKEELDAAVKAYQQMLRLEDSGQEFRKQRFYEELSNRFGRTLVNIVCIISLTFTY